MGSRKKGAWHTQFVHAQFSRNFHKMLHQPLRVSPPERCQPLTMHCGNNEVLPLLTAASNPGVTERGCSLG